MGQYFKAVFRHIKTCINYIVITMYTNLVVQKSSDIYWRTKHIVYIIVIIVMWLSFSSNDLIAKTNHQKWLIAN